MIDSIIEVNNMDKKLESRIARLEKILSKNHIKNEQMFSTEDIKLAIKDAYNALVFLHNALDDDGSPKTDTVENMLNELQYVADNWRINVGAY